MAGVKVHVRPPQTEHIGLPQSGAAAIQVATLKAVGGAMVPVVSTRTREGNSTRTDSRAAPATLRLHLDVSILRQAQDRYVAKDDDLSDCLGDGPCCNCRALRRPRSLKGSPTRVTSSRNTLTARTKRYGLTSLSTGLKTQLSAACLLLRGQLTCLPSCPRWATRDGKLPAQTLRSMVPPSQIGFQSKWRQKRGASGISTAPWCRARSRLTTRKASKKWWLTRSPRLPGGPGRQDVLHCSR